MQALVGQDASFDHGREQMALLAGLEVTAKSIERVAESIGADIAQREQQQIDRAVQLAKGFALDIPLVWERGISKWRSWSMLQVSDPTGGLHERLLRASQG